MESLIQQSALLDPLVHHVLPLLSNATLASLLYTGQWGRRLARPFLPQWKYACSALWIAKEAAKAGEMELALVYYETLVRRVDQIYLARKIVHAMGRVKVKWELAIAPFLSLLTEDGPRLIDDYERGRTTDDRRAHPTDLRDILRYGKPDDLREYQRVHHNCRWEDRPLIWQCAYATRPSVSMEMYRAVFASYRYFYWGLYFRDIGSINVQRAIECHLVHWTLREKAYFRERAANILYLIHTTRHPFLNNFINDARTPFPLPRRRRGLVLAYLDELRDRADPYNYRAIVKYQVDLHWPHEYCGRIRRRNRTLEQSACPPIRPTVGKR